MTSAGGVIEARLANQREGGGAIPTPALHSLRVCPISAHVAREVIVRHHYLHSFPGATQFSFGVFVGLRLKGALLLGCGSAQSYRLVGGAKRYDCATLSRLWLSDDLPANSESRVIGIVLRSLKKHTKLRFLISYADPSAGHAGTIYQATGWLYTGLSQPVPMFDLGDGVLRHNRSVSSVLGTRNTSFLNSKGIELKTVAQSQKHRYIYFLDKLRPATWNPNSMTPNMMAKLKTSLERYGVVENLVVRPLPDHLFEVLSGNQRLRVLHELGHTCAPCLVVELDDAQAKLLAQALNRIRGEDDLGLKAELVRQVLESIDSEDVLSLLPETEDSLEELASVGQETLEDHLQAWQQAQAVKLKHFAVQLTEGQLDVVEEALKAFLPYTKALKDENPNLRGNALYLLCRGYLEGTAGQGERA